jgi:hypothetical protein
MPAIGEKHPSRQLKACGVRARSEARASGAKSGSVDLRRRLSRRAVMKKSGEKGRRSFDAAIRIRHGADRSHGRDADRKISGPRYLASGLRFECEDNRGGADLN